MLPLKFTVFCFSFLFLQIDCHRSETKELCINSSDVLWNTLNFWDGANIIKKWKLKEIEKISEKCKDDMKEMIEGMSNTELWAVKMLDANGHYSGGIFNGNEFWMGSNTLCQQLQHLYSTLTSSDLFNEDMFYLRTQENRIITNEMAYPPFPVKFTVTKMIFKFNSFCQLSNRSETVINVGLCLPSSCSAPDVRTALEWATDKNIVDVGKVRMVPGEYNIWEDKRFYFLSFGLFILSLLMTLGTLLDIFLSKSSKLKSSWWFRILQAFSVLSNLKVIMSMKVGDDTLAPIHGLKFISMIWVISVHSCLMVFQVAENKKFRDKSESEIWYQTISNATYSVDTFFTVSGILVSFLFFRTLSKNPVKQLIGIDGILGHTILYICMLGFRLLRLSLPYLITIVLTGFLTEQKINNSPIPIPTADPETCVKYWWRNAIYVNTFYPGEEMCMNWSWYLANDTQFFVLGVPLLLLALRYRLASFVIGSSLMVLSWIITAIISHRNQHTVDVRDPFANYDALYDKPWMRFGPYFIGLIAGWFLFRINCTLKLPRRLSILVWFISLGSMLVIMYSPLYFPSNAVFGILIPTFSHSIWSAAVAWIVIACVTNNGFWIDYILSWKCMYPFSRISYCVYLIHPLIIRIIVLSADTSYFLSVEIMTVFILGFSMLSIFFGGLLSLAFESPIVALLRLGSPMKKNK